MPLHTEDHSSGQARWNARILSVVLTTMQRLEQRYLSRAEIYGTVRDRFPCERMPNLLLRGALQSLCHTGLVASDDLDLDQPTDSFRLTQTRRDFDPEQTWRLILRDPRVTAFHPHLYHSVAPIPRTQNLYH